MSAGTSKYTKDSSTVAGALSGVTGSVPTTEGSFTAIPPKHGEIVSNNGNVSVQGGK